MTYVIVLAVLFAVIFVVSAPLRRREDAVAGDEPIELLPPEQLSPEVLELQAARDAKYREIRDAELDHQTGKLSDADFDAIDSTLRAEAIEILRRLDDVTDED
jgi:hypothetical protein